MIGAPWTVWAAKSNQEKGPVRLDLQAVVDVAKQCGEFHAAICQITDIVQRPIPPADQLRMIRMALLGAGYLMSEEVG